MSLFDDNELYDIITKDKSKKAKKETKKAFLLWLDEFSVALKKQIQNKTLLDPTKKDSRTKKAREDFHYFRKTYFAHYYRLNGKSDLQKYLEESYQKIAKPKKRQGLKIAIAAPRGMGKSTDASVVFLLWCVVYDLKHFLVLVSDAVELTQTLIEAIKVELTHNLRLMADYPDACDIGAVWRVGEIVTSNNIKIKGFGNTKRIRGQNHGIYRVDLVVIDDLENDTNVRSRKQRDKLEEWVDEAVDNLGGIEGDLDVLYIGTLLHKDSVLARKLKLKFWHPIIFRAIISYPNNMNLWEEYTKLYKYSSQEKANQFYSKNKKEMDAGAVLGWNALSLEILMQKRATSLRAFNKEQQNSPASEDSAFNKSKFSCINKAQMPKLDYTFLFVDAKGAKSQKGDFTGFVGGGINKELKKLFIFYSYQARISGDKIVDKTIQLLEEFKFNIVSGDKNGGFYLLQDWLKERAFSKKIPILTKFFHHSVRKEDRMGELELPIEQEDIIFVGDHPELFNQLEDYPESDFDDLHDGLSMIYKLSKLQKLKKNRRRRFQRVRKIIKKWR
jgi:hypothetical protein